VRGDGGSVRDDPGRGAVATSSTQLCECGLMHFGQQILDVAHSPIGHGFQRVLGFVRATYHAAIEHPEQTLVTPLDAVDGVQCQSFRVFVAVRGQGDSVPPRFSLFLFGHETISKKNVSVDLVQLYRGYHMPPTLSSENPRFLASR